jgi:enoyl-CoA hydratase/carnithine racemase
MDLARTLAGLSPVAMAMGKQLIDQCWADEVHRGIRAELLSQTALFGSRDYAEARLARREGRPPEYRGL